ncbi:hypothetical protein [Tritonibacter sp. SIMBA_163]|uniref:hypothetical protein n=1 Tax=Tritonibacter sp. SIMBA_163 TaxID=3080868 RepID=UPI0039814493
MRLELAENRCALALVNLANDSNLRGCDLVNMKLIYIMTSGQITERASVLQSKTQKPVRFESSEGTQASLTRWMREPLMFGSEVLWSPYEQLHISPLPNASIICEWVTSAMLGGEHRL